MKRKSVMVLLGTLAAASVMLPSPGASAAEMKVAASDGRAEVVDGGSLAARSSGGGRPVGRPGGLVNCPEGYHLSPFEMPVYDDQGLFVVGYETVWFCIPDDLEPAG